MWFFLVQTLPVLAAAIGLGAVAGWLVWGGPSPSPAVAGVTPGAAKNFIPDLVGDPGRDAGATPVDHAPLEFRAAGPVGGSRGAFGSITSDLSQDIDVSLSSVAAIDNGPAAEHEFASGAVVPRGGAPISDAALLALQQELEAKRADVARLKTKLRKAVEEIERRTTQTVAAREARDAERRRALALEEQIANLPGPDTIPSVDQKTLVSLEADLERAKLRANHLAIEVEELAASHAQLQSSTAAERQALTVEAANLRLRTEGALDQLNEFSREVETFHAEHSQHLARSQQLMTELQMKLALARAALAGRPATTSAVAASLPAPTVPAQVAQGEGEASLEQLPGMSADLLRSLRELGVSSIHEVARWSSFDVQRIQGWLPEYPNVVVENRWVEHARDLVRANREPAGVIGV